MDKPLFIYLFTSDKSTPWSQIRQPSFSYKITHKVACQTRGSTSSAICIDSSELFHKNEVIFTKWV